MTHMQVTPEDLSAAAKSLDGKVTQLQGIHDTVESGILPAGAFGHLPGLSPHMDSVYSEHVSDTMHVMSRATEGLDATVRSLLATANGLLEMEKNTADHIRRSIPD